MSKNVHKIVDRTVEECYIVDVHKMDEKKER